MEETEKNHKKKVVQATLLRWLKDDNQKQEDKPSVSYFITRGAVYG